MFCKLLSLAINLQIVNCVEAAGTAITINLIVVWILQL